MSESSTALTLSFQREPLHDVWEALQPLLEEHWREVNALPGLSLDPAWERYTRLEQLGVLRLFTMRDYGALVGYAAFFVDHALHFRGALQAAQDVLFVDRPYRQVAARSFIQWCDEQLQGEGVRLVLHHVPESNNFSAVLRAVGYRPLERIWVRQF